MNNLKIKALKEKIKMEKTKIENNKILISNAKERIRIESEYLNKLEEELLEEELKGEMLK